MSIISAGTNVTSGLVLTSDTSGNLVVKTGSGAVTSATFKSNGSLVVTGTFSASSASLTTVTGTTAVFTSASLTTVTGTTSTFTTASDANGNLRSIPPSGSAKTSSYTLVVGDNGEYVELGSGGALTIPDAVFSPGNVVSVFNNTSSNATITCSITTAYIAGTDSDKATMTLAARGVATILFTSGTVCVVNGNVS